MSTVSVLQRRKDRNRTILSQKNATPVATAELFPINFLKGRIYPIVSHLLGWLHKQTNKQASKKTHLASTVIYNISQIVNLKSSLSMFCCLSFSVTSFSVNDSGAGRVHASSSKVCANERVI